MKQLYLALFACLVFTFSAFKASAQAVPQFQEHIVKKGETPAAIASHYKIKKVDFLMLNNFPEDIKLEPGQVVLIKELQPGEKPAGESASTDKKEKKETASKKEKPEKKEKETTSKSSKKEKPEKEKKETASKKSKKSKTGKEEVAAASSSEPEGDFFEEHTVSKGESVSSLVKLYKIDKNQFLSLNGLSKNAKLSPGQTVKIRRLTEAEYTELHPEFKKKQPEPEPTPAPVAEEPKAEEPVAAAAAPVDTPAETPAAKEEPAPTETRDTETKTTEAKSSNTGKKSSSDKQQMGGAGSKKSSSTSGSSASAGSKPSKPVPGEDFSSGQPKTDAEGNRLEYGPGGTVYKVSTNGYHIVEKNQTFYRIALIYGIPMDELQTINNLSTTILSVGQKLKVTR